jgi:undecaprenyl-diphosphatase
VRSLLDSIIIGLLQGLLEWLPVSSEGNLFIVFVGIIGLNAEEILSTIIFIHIGTGIASLIFFREEIFKILKGHNSEYIELRLKLFIMTLITGIIGYPLYLWLNMSSVIGETLLALIGLALISTGLIQRQAWNKMKTKSELTWSMSIILGFVQGLAIIPGLSRSGLTTSILLLRNFTSEEAFRISFLMSIPVSFAAAFGIIILDGFTPDLLTIISVITAAIIGYISIDTLLKVSRKVNFWKICISLGVLAILTWLPNLVF